ncbi:MAG: hypothetical protein WCD76_12470, partial [Pyrinomonadaceae bacterium]
DHRENAQVCRQLGKLVALREQDTLLHKQKNSTSVITWEGAKGIDDAVLQNTRLRILDIEEWHGTLAGRPRAEVEDVWAALSYSPARVGDAE